MSETPKQVKSLKELEIRCTGTNVESIICKINELQCVNGHKSFEKQLGDVIQTAPTEKYDDKDGHLPRDEEVSSLLYLH